MNTDKEIQCTLQSEAFKLNQETQTQVDNKKILFHSRISQKK